MDRIRALLRPAGDPNMNRVRRRTALVSALTRRIRLIQFTLFCAGYLWMLALPSPRLGRGTYIDENALGPGQVNTYWNWGDVANADRYLEHLEGLRDRIRAKDLMTEFMKLGIPASTQNYVFTSSTEVEGTNAYAVLSSPRTSGTEAMVISASWISRIGEGGGTLNLRGVSTVLALANFLKNIVFVISDNYVDGMQAWLNSYHGETNLQADELELASGVIWTALNIDYPGHSFSHLGIFHEGINGRLPNQDLLNSFHHISNQIPSWIPGNFHQELREYKYRSKNARGRGSGVHGLFHQFRIDAFTMFGLPAVGPHGFHAIGRRRCGTTNNLLERLHASFFFYILTTPDRFLKIGSFLPSAVLISVAMMFGGLKLWSDSAWILDTSIPLEKQGDTGIKWIQRSRPVIPVLGIMLSTHILGGILFSLVSIMLSVVVTATLLCGLRTPSQRSKPRHPFINSSKPILLGIPLSISSPSQRLPLRLAKFASYIGLGLGWIFAGEELRKALWDWEVLRVWFAPFVCIVYTPLVLQAGLFLFCAASSSSSSSSSSSLSSSSSSSPSPSSSPSARSSSAASSSSISPSGSSDSSLSSSSSCASPPAIASPPSDIAGVGASTGSSRSRNSESDKSGFTFSNISGYEQVRRLGAWIERNRAVFDLRCDSVFV
ncbi:Gaa1-domain-containing protein [Mycena olivaceomarginata]|nr:Gaa1-domain-containing protein [Mycena olivaceomarginata]